MPPDDLLPAQRQAVTFTGGALLVLGAAGTGKTRVALRALSLARRAGPAARPDRRHRAVARAGPTRCATWLERGTRPGLRRAGRGHARPAGHAAPERGHGRTGHARSDARSQRALRPADGADRRAAAGAPRLRRQRPGAADRLRAPDRPPQGPPDRRRGLRPLGGRRWTTGPSPGRRHWSASSPRSTAPTSGSWPRPACATPATCCPMRLRLIRERPATVRRFDHVLVDDAHELEPAPGRLALELAAGRITAAADPVLGGLPARRGRR